MSALERDMNLLAEQIRVYILQGFTGPYNFTAGASYMILASIRFLTNINDFL